jgi:hypothetical protein
MFRFVRDLPLTEYTLVLLENNGTFVATQDLS